MYCHCICADRRLTEFTIQNVHLFERLGTRVDISTPAGAWHYATILCRLAVRHARRLENEFENVKTDFIDKAMTGKVAAWTADEQIAQLDKEAREQQAQTQ